MYTKDKRTVTMTPLGGEYRRVSDGRIFKLVSLSPGGSPQIQEDGVPLLHTISARWLSEKFRPR